MPGLKIQTSTFILYMELLMVELDISLQLLKVKEEYVSLRHTLVDEMCAEKSSQLWLY
jgi:hypothetical protein